MIDNINRGKSLILLELCEKWNITYSVENTGQYDNHVLTNKRNERMCFHEDYSVADFYGNLIDYLVKKKYNKEDTFLK